MKMFAKSLALSFLFLAGTALGDVKVNYQAPEIVSVNGTIDVVLNISFGHSLNGTRYSPQYNDGPIGPTLRVQPGDVLTVTLNNNLPPSPPRDIELLQYIQDPQNEIDNDANVTKIYNRLSAEGNVYDPEFGFWGFSLANIHFHGAGFPPSVEDLHNPIDGQESRTFTVEIPDDHPPGLVWYHGHVHGNAEYEIMSGLYGAIIIEGTANDVTSIAEIAAATEVVLVLSEALTDEATGIPPPFFPIAMAFGWSSIVNGQLAEETMFEFTQGETVLFRSINAGVEPPADLYFSGDDATPKFWIVAEDGFPVPELEESDSVYVGVGSRMEFMVKFDEPGTYTLRRAAWAPGPNGGITGVEACNATFGIPAPNCVSYDIDKPVAIITVLPSDEPIEADLPTKVPEYHELYKELEAMPVANSRTIVQQIAMSFPLFQIPYDGPFVPPGMGWGINGRFLTPHYSHGDIIAGTCEQWDVIGDPPMFDHAIHIHTNPFLVTHEDGIPVDEPFWRDTYTIRGHNITIKTCFNRLEPGDYVFVHCHQLTHVDIGMGAYFTVVGGNATDGYEVDDGDETIGDEGMDEDAVEDEDVDVVVDKSGPEGDAKDNVESASSALSAMSSCIGALMVMAVMW